MSSAVGKAPHEGTAGPIEEGRRLYSVAEALEAERPRGQYAEALKTFVAYVETHRRSFEPEAPEFSHRLDQTAMAFYRMSQPELAVRAIDLGLVLAPEAPQLLYHKALFFLTQNRDVAEALELLDRALTHEPHDKGIWAAKGDALRLLGRSDEAADAYLHAQQLDATSMQYVDRALKLVPNHPTALRMRLQLARAHGGDAKALEACDTLLKDSPNDVELVLARAEILYGLGKIPPALESLERAESLKPEGDPRFLFLRGRLYLGLGRTEEAMNEFSRLLESSPRSDAASLKLVADAVESHGGNPALAIAARKKLQDLEPRNLENLNALRGLAARSGDADLGVSTCCAILAVSPDNLQALRALAEFYLMSNRTDEAFTTFRELMRTHPGETADVRRALEAATAANRPDLVKEFAQSNLKANPGDASTLEGLFRSQLAAGERADALQTLDQLVGQHPLEVRYLLDKKTLLVELGRADDLPPVYDELFRLDPTRSDIAFERGELSLQRALDAARGGTEREHSARAALVSFERASLDPVFVDRSLLGLAQASRLLNDSDRACRAYRDFLARPGNDRRGDVWKELGHSLREADHLTEAERAYEQAIQLGREDRDLYWGAASTLSALNREEQSLRYIDLLLEREPHNPLYLRRQGQLLLALNRRDEGLSALKRAAQGAHGDPHVHFEVAQALRSHGAYQDAVASYRKGLELDSKSREGRLGLAETLQLNGQFNEVVPIVDELLKEDPNDLPAWQCRADAYRSLGHTPEVVYSLKAVLLLDPHNAAGLLEKYRLHLELGEKAEAYEALDELLKLNGAEAQDSALLLQHGDLAAALGKAEEANHSFELAGQREPSQLPEIAARRARVRLAAGRPDLALEILDSSLAQSPEGKPRSIALLLLRAEILMALERPAEARQVYEEVRAREPRSPVVIAGVGRCLLDQGQHEEARQFLRTSLGHVPPSPPMYLMLAEAEAGLGSIPDAIATIQQGVEQLPKSPELWSRLAELYIARESWAEASGALAHAIALDATNASLLLRAGFVADRLGHPNEALALYDHATQVAPGNVQTWTSKGLALLATGRPSEAVTAFERALALDSDFEPAKDGKRVAHQKTRESQIGSVGRDALLLESKLRRPVTKNDLFVTLHVPYDMLDPVLEELAETPKVDLDTLGEADLRDLETASYRLINAALEHRPEGIERRGLTLADIAALSPPSYTLATIQRLFGYFKAVLDADVRPENLKLTPDIEELVRQAITTIPSEQRTLFQIVRRLRVGIFKARIVKAVESAGSAVHAPLPSLDLSPLGPEFQSVSEEAPAPAPAPRGPAARVKELVAEPVRPVANVVRLPPPAHHAGHADATARCVGCGGIAAVQHECGAPLCQTCVAQFHTCPKCRKEVTASSGRPVGGPAGHHGKGPPPSPASPDGFSLSSTVARVRTPKVEPSPSKAEAAIPKPPRPPDHPKWAEHARAPDHTKPSEHGKAGDHPPPPAHAKPSEAVSPRTPDHPHPPASSSTVEPKQPPAPAEEKPPAKAVHAHEKPDDEPRL